jgi:hypothetical protein
MVATEYSSGETGIFEYFGDPLLGRMGDGLRDFPFIST